MGSSSSFFSSCASGSRVKCGACGGRSRRYRGGLGGGGLSRCSGYVYGGGSGMPRSACAPRLRFRGSGGGGENPRARTTASEISSRVRPSERRNTAAVSSLVPRAAADLSSETARAIRSSSKKTHSVRAGTFFLARNSTMDPLCQPGGSEGGGTGGGGGDGGGLSQSDGGGGFGGALGASGGLGGSAGLGGGYVQIVLQKSVKQRRQSMYFSGSCSFALYFSTLLSRGGGGRSRTCSP